MAGLLILVLAIFNISFQPKAIWLGLALTLMFAGIVWYAKACYAGTTPGIKNDGVFFKSMSSRGLWAYLTGLGLTGFYIILYCYSDYLGLEGNGENPGVIAL